METEFIATTVGRVTTAEEGTYITLEPAFAPALTGLEGFGAIVVTWWAHLVDVPELRDMLTAFSPYKEAPAELGIFATRSPVRPNPICHSVVHVISINHENGRIAIPFIDAEDGTPVLDIKPYHPSTDRLREVTLPDWCRDWPQWQEDAAVFDWSAVFENAM